MLILLPPSEGKTAPTRGKALEQGSLSFPSLRPTRERLVDALVTLCRDEPGAACTAYWMLSPHCAPSPSSCSKRGVSCGVEISRMSRIP
ncbi:MAG: hypothetical protein LT071_06535, partial [Nocardioides sp.]|nr:hypothetical protein [Nocardioides sp.]